MAKARRENLQSPDCKIGWDWPMLKINGKLYARSPTGQLVRVTDADINREVLSLTQKFGFGKGDA